MPISVKLNQLRNKKGASLQDVADAVGVSKTHIWEMEKGRSDNPTLEMLTKLANYFDVTIKYLVGEDTESSDNEQLARMFRQVGELDEADRAFLDDMVQSMRKRRDDKN